MHFVIMGCGRTGATLAQMVQDRGHTVAVIDHNPDAFRRLGPQFEGQRVIGQGFDRDTLTEAGIERAYAFAAVSSGDNSNIIAARIARETFSVSTVVARIYDPGRAEVYERLGIPTVATVRWTADQVCRRILPSGADEHYRDSSGNLILAEIQVHPGWVGRSMQDFDALGCRVAYLTRLGAGLLPTAETLFQEGDLLHAFLPAQELPKIERSLAAAPTGETI